MRRALNFLRQLKRAWLKYQPSVEILISGANLIHNLAEHRRAYPDLAFAPVLKSNAYGHGLVPVARILDRESITFFVVDSLFEARILRQEGIKSEILVIGYTSAANIAGGRVKNTAFAITSLEQLRALAGALDKKIKFHLKVDTGMNRQGILPEQLAAAAEIIRGNRFFDLEGVCSHLADADGDDQSFTQQQIGRWWEIEQFFKTNFPEVKYYHLSASAGAVFSRELTGSVVRLGLGLYGFNASPRRKLDLKPALRMRSVISSVKRVRAGEAVGYNLTFRPEKEIVMATLPVGYYEGIDRRLSNKGFLKVNGNFCPIIGRVSMNIAAIDVSQVPGVKLGEAVEIISDQPGDRNSVENMAVLAQTIPYEILVHLPPHLRRVIE